MDADQQKQAIAAMQRDMHHVLAALKDIKEEMATKTALTLLATRSEVEALSHRLDMLERDMREKSPAAIWKIITGVAAGIVALAAALAWIIKMAKGLP